MEVDRVWSVLMWLGIYSLDVILTRVSTRFNLTSLRTFSLAQTLPAALAPLQGKLFWLTAKRW